MSDLPTTDAPKPEPEKEDKVFIEINSGRGLAVACILLALLCLGLLFISGFIYTILKLLGF